MTPSAILLPCPFPVFLCDSWHKIFFLLCGCPTSFTRTQALWGQNVCLFGFLPASTLQRTRPGTKQAHTQNTALMNEKKNNRNSLLYRPQSNKHDTVPPLHSNSPRCCSGEPSLAPVCLRKSYLSRPIGNPSSSGRLSQPAPAAGISSPLNCLPWYLLSLGH